MKVVLKVAPAAMLPEANDCAPAGTLIDVTVCELESSFVHVTVALTPLTTVTVTGE